MKVIVVIFNELQSVIETLLIHRKSKMCAYKETLPNEMYDYAREHLGETEESRQDSLLELNEWLDANPQIYANRDPVVLIHFLRGSKFRMEKAKRRLEM